MQIVDIVVLVLHVLGATIWTGGHLVLSTSVLPKALARRSPEVLQEFESGFERVGIPALIVQVLTGIWLLYRLLPGLEGQAGLTHTAGTDQRQEPAARILDEIGNLSQLWGPSDKGRGLQGQVVTRHQDCLNNDRLRRG